MTKPKRFFILCNKTFKTIRETDIPPRDSDIWWKYRTIYIDTRYEAKLRLYNYYERKTREARL